MGNGIVATLRGESLVTGSFIGTVVFGEGEANESVVTGSFGGRAIFGAFERGGGYDRARDRRARDVFIAKFDAR